jgi:hypothetical protein
LLLLLLALPLLLLLLLDLWLQLVAVPHLLAQPRHPQLPAGHPEQWNTTIESPVPSAFCRKSSGDGSPPTHRCLQDTQAVQNTAIKRKMTWALGLFGCSWWQFYAPGPSPVTLNCLQDNIPFKTSDSLFPGVSQEKQ